MNQSETLFRTKFQPLMKAWLDSDKSERLAYLRDRWQDEKEYEGFDVYKVAAKALAPEGTEFVSLTKSPFVMTVRYQYFSARIKVLASRTVINYEVDKAACIKATTKAATPAPVTSTGSPVDDAAKTLGMNAKQVRTKLRARGLNAATYPKTAGAIVNLIRSA